MFRLIQLHRPPSTQASVSRSNAVLGDARSNVLERSAAQHGAGKALRHQRRGCAVLHRSAAGALGTSDRASRAAVQVRWAAKHLLRLETLASSAFVRHRDANQRRNPVVNGAVPGAVPVGLAVRMFDRPAAPSPMLLPLNPVVLKYLRERSYATVLPLTPEIDNNNETGSRGLT